MSKFRFVISRGTASHAGSSDWAARGREGPLVRALRMIVESGIVGMAHEDRLDDELRRLLQPAAPHGETTWLPASEDEPEPIS